MRGRGRLLLAIVALGYFVVSDVRAQVPAAETTWVRDHDVAVPMRDGVVLRADVWRPQGTGPFPVLVYRTPYGKSAAQTDYATFSKAVQRGYAVVMQDVRGRFASATTWRPHAGPAAASRRPGCERFRRGARSGLRPR